MLTFRQFQKMVTERLIILNNGANYGQIVIMGGGAGVGKSYVVHNLLETQKFKIIDVDAWKSAFVKMQRYPEWKDFDMKDPSKVAKLQLWIVRQKIRDKVLDLLFNTPRNRAVLPNVLFDISMANPKQMTQITDMVEQAGYDAKNVHLVYVITDWEIALNRNRGRERVLDDGVILKTLQMSAGTFLNYIENGLPHNFNGEIKLVMTHGKQPEYFTLKRAGQSLPNKSQLLTYCISMIKQFTSGMPPKPEKK